MTKIGDVICNDGETIGYYTGVREFVVEAVEDYINNRNYEEVEDMCELLRDIDKFENEDRLIIVKDHNGMGYTVELY